MPLDLRLIGWALRNFGLALAAQALTCLCMYSTISTERQERNRDVRRGNIHLVCENPLPSLLSAIPHLISPICLNYHFHRVANIPKSL